MKKPRIRRSNDVYRVIIYVLYAIYQFSLILCKKMCPKNQKGGLTKNSRVIHSMSRSPRQNFDNTPRASKIVLGFLFFQRKRGENREAENRQRLDMTDVTT